MVQMGISGNKGGADVLGVELTLGIVALTMDWNFNWSRLMILDAHYPILVKIVESLDIKNMGPNVFGLLNQTRKGAQVTFRGFRPLEKFGRFGEIDGDDHGDVPNVIIAEEHDTQPQMEGSVDVQASLGSKDHTLDENVIEIIDHEADITLGEVEAFENLIPRKRSRHDPCSEPCPVVRLVAGTSISEQRSETERVVQSTSEKEIESSQVLKDASKGKQIKEAPVDVHVLQERVFVLEQKLKDQVLQSVTKYILISELQENQVAQNLKIQTLEANLRYLTALFMDLKQQLNKTDDIDGVQEKRGDGDEGGSSGDGLEISWILRLIKERKVQTEGSRKEKVSYSAGYHYLNVDKWVAGEKLDTSEHLVIPSVRHKDYFKQQQDLPKKYVISTGKNFYDKVGDRSGIHSWHYDRDRRMWVVKRKSGNLEYYQSPGNFESWIRVDFVELDEAPFFNRSNDPRGTDFYDFLHEEVCFNFKRMKTDESTVKKHKGIRDDGCLSKFVMWAIDSESSEAVINCGHHEYHILDKNDLLRFGEHDIKILTMHQIKTDPVFEVHGKDFTSLATSIVRTKLWAGSKVMQTLPIEP
ncbi:hypothetical protein R6Q57_018579 [Mikania cordata]